MYLYRISSVFCLDFLSILVGFPMRGSELCLLVVPLRFHLFLPLAPMRLDSAEKIANNATLRADASKQKLVERLETSGRDSGDDGQGSAYWGSRWLVI